MVLKRGISNMGVLVKEIKYTIYVDLKTVIERKNITRGELVKKTGLKYDTINRYYKNEVFVVDLDVLARLCIALDCLPGDIIKLDRMEYEDTLI